MVTVGDEGTGRPTQQGDGPRVVNAFVEGRELVLVVPDTSEPSGVRLRRQPAEYSCQIRQAEVPEELRRMLRDSSHVVRGMRDEGEWLRVYWRTFEDCRQYCKLLREKAIATYEGGIDPVLRWMADSGAVVAPRRLGYFDLESDSRVPFSRLATARILSWALLGPEGELVEVLDEDTEEAERRLLLSLWGRINRIDQVAAWNGDRFDFPLLQARTRHHGIAVPWKRWLWVDHLELFRKMNMAAESGDEKQSLALGAITQAVLGESKDDLDASKTWAIWSAGAEECRLLAKYNLRDVQLMQALEEKTGYIALLGSLAEACGSFPDSRGMLATVQTESLLQRLAVQRGYRSPTVMKRSGRAATEQFRGAYVMEPAQRGIVKNVHVADFASLYPTIIRTWNMSPETKTSDHIYPKAIEDAVRRNVSASPWSKEPECVAPITGIIFKAEPEGLLSGAVAEMMRLRKAWSDRKAAAAPETEEWKDADRRSTAYKIAANSCYGATGMSTFRHFDVEVAESVSQCAVWLIQQTIKAAEGRGLQAIYADTDSMFVSGCTRDEFAEFTRWCNEELYPQILACVGCKPGLINLAYEKAFERVIFIQKKRYCGRYSHYKGTDATAESKPEVKGLEYKRGDSIRLARRLQEQAVLLLVGQVGGGIEDPAAYERLLETWRQRILTDPLELDDVVISKGLNKPISGYATCTKKDGTQARQLPHIEVAKILIERGREVTEGTRISYVVVDGSSNPQRVIPAEDWVGEVDRVAAWESLVAPPTIRVLEAAFPEHEWKPFKQARPGEKKWSPSKAARLKSAGPDLFDRGNG